MAFLPRMYAPVYIKFATLRLGVGPSMGIVEYDTEVIRRCRRVATREGWEWQICDYHIYSKYDATYDMDKECIDAHMDEFEYQISTKKDYINQEKRVRQCLT